jgi:branched-chain amino acid transport system ATP-binding protein
MPRSRLHLTAQDWKEIDAAFADNDDPLLGADARDSFRQLFRRIVNLAPPPLGVGPAR